MSLAFRRATAADLPAIIEMLADDELGRQREDTSVPVADCYREAFSAIDRDGNQFLAVAENSGEIVGTLQLTFLPGLSHQGLWRGQIESVRVSSKTRGGGIGRQMLEWAITTCKERGCRIIQLTSDKSRTDAIRFYESLGFTASHEGFKLKL
ncbi:GNAT family N-acetyltransferase [Nisaea sediminum]|uniref:GNAT family N-acetyltransferase n=1 Tax=Nisaea sediminum TaxID=2775867 RepID=UPI001866E161|nr:GNAT family N-acetyltransferase [Nisaea sediminum]